MHLRTNPATLRHSASTSTPQRMATRAAQRIAWDIAQRKAAAAIRAEHNLLRLLTTPR